MMVKTRLWLAGEVSEQRDMTLDPSADPAGAPLCPPPPPLVLYRWVRTPTVRAIREPFRAPLRRVPQGRPRASRRNVCVAQVVKRDAQRRVVDVERRIVEGTPARVETLRRRAQGEGVINTAGIERLNATFRERLASLTRRARALVRRTVTLQHGMYLIGTVDNFCPPHARLAHGGGNTTPAMAAGITDHGWRVQELLSFHGPPPPWTPPKQRGRPSHALKRVIARWAGTTVSRGATRVRE